MPASFELGRLDPVTFEHLVNMLAMRVIGDGLSGFGPGADGGRDGYFEGAAPYPSAAERWSGSWYIQSKFHRPQLSGDSQKWLLEQIKSEVSEFQKPRSRRKVPNNWILVTNIDPSGVPETGSFDQARLLVSERLPELGERFHIWGGRKVLDLLARYPEAGDYYAEFLTPGQLLTAMFRTLTEGSAQAEKVLRYFLVDQLDQQKHTRLEQAGSTTDNRPGIHHLFVDLPVIASSGHRGMGAAELARTIAYDHDARTQSSTFAGARDWALAPQRARAWLLKGGPGQGKSTLTQFMCQLQRAAILLRGDAPPITPVQRDLVAEIQKRAGDTDLWPLLPRIPVVIELREFAQWYGQRGDGKPSGVLTYLSETLTKEVEQETYTGTLLTLFGGSKWLFVFDGLDEVPTDVKDGVSSEVVKFANSTLVGCHSDCVIVCTSRPQGYSGQLGALDAAVIDLLKLTPEQALDCAEPVLRIERSVDEGDEYCKILTEAIKSSAVREIMTTPLQAHIMAVVVRDGSKPPERKWQLFNRFYTVIKNREANRSLPSPELARLLQEDRLLKAIHNRLGFELHKKAETAIRKGARNEVQRSAFLDRKEFERVARETVEQLQDEEIDATVAVLMNATTDRLVLVSTPESGSEVRFDIRPLQEFFAAEYMYELVEAEVFRKRVYIIAPDSHWREVMHFLMSALIENARQTELSLAANILTEVNSDPEDGQRHLFYRRVAFGALIVARLVEEGVLGQDKRVRSQLQPCLEPLLASYEALDGITSAPGLHTRQWIIGLFIRQLHEKALSENAGACAALLAMLTDDNPQSAAVQIYLNASSTAYIGSVIRLLSHFDPAMDGRLSLWTVRFLIEIKLSANWNALEIHCLEALDSMLAEHEAAVEDLASDFGVSEKSKTLWKTLLIDAGVRRRALEDPNQPPQHIYGLLQAKCRGPLLDLKSFSQESWRMLEAGSGFLKACYSIFRLAIENTDVNLGAVLAAVNHRQQLLSAMSDAVTSWVPKNRREFIGISTSWKHCELPSDEGEGIVCDLMLSDRADGLKQEWDKILVDAPDVALSLIYRYGGRDLEAVGQDVLSEAVNRRALLDGFEQSPRSIANSVLYWGHLVTADPDWQEVVRSMLLRCPEDLRQGYSFMQVISTFALRLPEEALLLPHILNALVARAFPPFMGGIEPEEKSRGQVLRDYVLQFIPDINALNVVIADSSLGPNTRGAATLMLLVAQANGSMTETKWVEMVPAFATAENLTWYVRAAARSMSDLISQRHQPALKVMGQLFEAARLNFSARSNVQDEIDYWRQSSRAPVTEAVSKGLNPF